MSRDDFGPGLRRERERQGISLEALAETTKVSIELWEGMERNDFSRWPSGIFARAFVRDYAQAIGLDSDAVVNEFCRYFPNGDRRANRIVQGQAHLIGHRLEANDRELLPAGRERRRARDRAPSGSAFDTYAPRLTAAAVDVVCVSGAAVFATAVGGTGVLAGVGVISLVYFSVGTIWLGTTPGGRIVAALRLRVPSLFTSRRTVSA